MAFATFVIIAPIWILPGKTLSRRMSGRALSVSAQDIEFEWIDEQTLKTAHVSQGVARHAGTGERVFFNQAHLFHVSSLPRTTASTLLQLFGEDGLPRHAAYGDGEKIALEELDRIRNAFKANAVDFPWQLGDILLLDNMQIARGRRPFKGERKLLAALLESSSQRPQRDHSE